MNQRIDSLREKVIYPERISHITDVMTAITAWESSYTELVEMSSGNFKLDEKGRIGALKRLLPQPIVSSMILISSNLRTYRDARAFALEQAAELRNSSPKKQGHANNVVPSQDTGDEDFDPWANGQGNNGDTGDASEDWSSDQISAVLNALKG